MSVRQIQGETQFSPLLINVQFFWSRFPLSMSIYSVNILSVCQSGYKKAEMLIIMERDYSGPELT